VLPGLGYPSAMDRRLSFLAQDPDERTIRWGWVFWIAWAAVGGALLLGDYRGGAIGIGAVLAAPFWALWALWAAYRALRAFMRWQGAAAWGVPNGQHYEFDGRRVRVSFDGDNVWFAAGDVFDVLGTPSDARDPGRVRLIVGRDGLTELPSTGVLSFSEKGLAAWLDRRTDRTAGQFTRWVDTQVVAPYRRRRELERAVDSNP
jgi:hypothetical protein